MTTDPMPLADLRALIDYAWADEEHDYADNPGDRHIFLVIQRLDDWLTDYRPEPETAPPPGTPADAELVTFWWTRHHGDCVECSNPAAYDVIDAYGPEQHMRACSRCAALHAAEGSQIVFLNAENDTKGRQS